MNAWHEDQTNEVMMAMKTRLTILAVMTAFGVGVASAGEVTGLTSFSSGTPAKAAEVNGNFTAVKTAVDDNNSEIVALKALVADLQARLAAVEGNSVLLLKDKLSLVGGTTARFEGVNVQVVNGAGTTDSLGSGLGNLIVGYDEGGLTLDKTGSHNVVVGGQHNYSSYGGLVAGTANTAAAPNVFVSGRFNVAEGNYASVSGGESNTASAHAASVSGGVDNQATGGWASVSGGGQNTAENLFSSVSGGTNNIASGRFTSVSGGENNQAGDRARDLGANASVSGGRFNIALGEHSSVSGGGGPLLGLGNEATGDYASVSGGSENTADGHTASVSGGLRNFASGQDASVSGGAGNSASNSQASVTGGRQNQANGEFSSVSGGAFVTAPNTDDWAAGTLSSP